jgi:hypothetical protein
LTGVILGLFVISLLLFLGAINYFLVSQKAGVYPPRKVLVKKALSFGALGGVILLIAIILFFVNR